MEYKSNAENTPKWLYALALFVMLYLMYSSTFLTDYLMRDEWEFVGGDQWYDLGAFISTFFFRSGRALFPVFQKLVLAFTEYDAQRIQIVRFVNFASIGLIAILLLNFLQAQVKNKLLAFWAILFFFSQTSFQVLMGYSFELVSGSLPSMWLSLLAFYLYFYVFSKKQISIYLQMGITFILLMLAMQSTQTYAYFSLIPMSYLALSDWKNNKTRIIQFIGVSVLTFIASGLIYKFSFDYLISRGMTTYDVGEQGLKSLSSQPLDVFLLAINPRTYWSVFKLWTFPFPFHNTAPLTNLTQKIASFGLMLLWLGIIFTAIWIEIKNALQNEKREILLKWFMVLICFGLAATFIIADSPLVISDHRPHLLLTFLGLVIFASVYAFEVISPQFPFLLNTRFNVVIGFMVLMTAFGAQAGTLRNIVNIHLKQLDFIRVQLLTQDPASYTTIIVLLPVENQVCITEPCGPWVGEHIENKGHLARESAYRYALSTLGIDPTIKQIIFVEKASEIILQENTIIIDWNIYTISQQLYAEHFIP